MCESLFGLRRTFGFQLAPGLDARAGVPALHHPPGARDVGPGALDRAGDVAEVELHRLVVAAGEGERHLAVLPLGQQPGHLARGGEGGVRAAGAAALEDGADEALERRVDGLGPARVAGGADHLGQLPRVRGAAVEALADGAVQDLVDGDDGGAAAQVGHQGDGLVGDEAEVTVARLHPPDARHLGLQAEDEPVVVCGGHEAGVEGGGADNSLRATRPPRRAGARSRIHV